MSREPIAQLCAKTALFYQYARQWASRVPVMARVVLGLFLVAALLMTVRTALVAKDASLHLKLQHGFHTAQVQVWVDGELAYSGKVNGAPKKRFGLIPTDSVQGSRQQERQGGCAQTGRLVAHRHAAPGLPRRKRTTDAARVGAQLSDHQ